MKVTTGYMTLFEDSLTYYFGVWSNPQNDVVRSYINNVAWDRCAESTSVATFNTSVYVPIGTDHDPDPSGHIVVEENSQRCRPGQAIFNVNVTYEDGAQAFEIHPETDSIRVLGDLTKPNHLDSCPSGYSCCNSLKCSCRPLSDTNLQWFSDANCMAIIESMTLALAGQYNVEIAYPAEAEFNYTKADGDAVTLMPVSTSNANYEPIHLGDHDQTLPSSGPQNGTIIASTALNHRARQYNISDSKGPDLVIDQDVLNKILQNITLTLMNSFNSWKTEVNTTTSTFRNVYSFSNRLNLLLPYYLSLIVALPLLVIGGVCLHHNGVSATDGGFLQILTTTSNSRALHDAASIGALGGEENVPEG